MQERIIEVDARRRISLGDLAQHDRYVARSGPDGVIVLSPAVVLTVEQYNNLLSDGEPG